MNPLVKIAFSLFAASSAMMVLAAENYPSKPIKIIVPFPPGGGTDSVARIVAAKLGDRLKVAVTVENRPGGNTLIGAEAAARSPADGYTLFVPIDSTLAMNQWLYSKLPYDPAGFTPITLATNMPMVLAVNPAVKASSVKELVNLVRVPGAHFAYAFGALPAQVAGEAFKEKSKSDMTAIPYKGSAPAMTDTIGGTTPAIFDALGPAMAFIKAGKVRALAVTGAKRSTMLPEIPTLAESGYPDIDLVTWIGFVAPGGVDRAIVTKLNTEIVSILSMPETRTQLSSLGMDVVASSPEQFGQIIKSDSIKFEKIIKSAGIQLN